MLGTAAFSADRHIVESGQALEGVRIPLHAQARAGLVGLGRVMANEYIQHDIR